MLEAMAKSAGRTATTAVTAALVRGMLGSLLGGRQAAMKAAFRRRANTSPQWPPARVARGAAASMLLRAIGLRAFETLRATPAQRASGPFYLRKSRGGTSTLDLTPRSRAAAGESRTERISLRHGTRGSTPAARPHRAAPRPTSCGRRMRSGRYIHPPIPMRATARSRLSRVRHLCAREAYGPVPHPDDQAAAHTPGRTPHIHFIVIGGRTRLTTQNVLRGEPRNERDGLYRHLDAEDRRASTGRFIDRAAARKTGRSQ
jgi:hypothetical protein